VPDMPSTTPEKPSTAPGTPSMRDTDIRHTGNHESDTPGLPDTDTPDTSGMPGTCKTDIHDAGNQGPDTLRIPDLPGTHDTSTCYAGNHRPDTPRTSNMPGMASNTPGTVPGTTSTRRRDIRRARNHAGDYRDGTMATLVFFDRVATMGFLPTGFISDRDPH
jgi:hypothetical protein